MKMIQMVQKMKTRIVRRLAMQQRYYEIMATTIDLRYLQTSYAEHFRLSMFCENVSTYTRYWLCHAASRGIEMSYGDVILRNHQRFGSAAFFRPVQ